MKARLPLDCVVGVHGLPDLEQGLLQELLAALEARGARVAVVANGVTIKRFADALDRTVLSAACHRPAPSGRATAIELLRSLRHTETERPLLVVLADGNHTSELTPRLEALGEAGACVLALCVAEGEDSALGAATPFEGDEWTWKTGRARVLLDTLITNEIEP